MSALKVRNAATPALLTFSVAYTDIDNRFFTIYVTLTCQIVPANAKFNVSPFSHIRVICQITNDEGFSSAVHVLHTWGLLLQ